MQTGQSTADGASRHSCGEHAQSAHLIINLDDVGDANSGIILVSSYIHDTAAVGNDMWFVTLVKNAKAPTKEDAMTIQATMKEAESWGVKFHQGFVTLGKYDGVWITEAPDEKVALRTAMLFNSKLGGNSSTMPAISFEELMGWLQKM